MKKQTLTTQQTLTTTISQQQVRFVRMVEMTAPEVEEAVEKELEENPALEVVDSAGNSNSTSSEIRQTTAYAATRVGKNYDFFDRGESSGSLLEELSSQIDLRELNARIALAAHYIVGNLDSNGYLARPLQSIGNDIFLSEGEDLSLKELEEGLAAVQSCDPPGVGGRDVQESLIIQARRVLDGLDADNPERLRVENALKILTSYIDLLSLHHYEVIERRMRLSAKEVEDAVGFIRKLNPRPGASYESGVEQWNYVVPDFIIKISDERKMDISLNNVIPELSISRSFEEAVESMNAEREGRKAAKELRQGKEFIIDRYVNARDFIKVLQRRQETLFNVMTAIAHLQRDYITTQDESKLHPMGLKDVAAATGYDLSLISRSTSNKHVALPWGIVPLRFFFSETFGNSLSDDGTVSGRSVESAIRLIVDEEDKRRPLSDDAITRKLNAKGLEVSRRTVNKYRDRLNIPPARLRKKR